MAAQRNDTELPPRARRIRFTHEIFVKIWGTTSACAENTLKKSSEN